MGSNIHIHGASLPDSLGEGSNTLPRHSVSDYKFMRLVWEDHNSKYVCSCGDDHDYYCTDIVSRPLDFQKLRESIKELGLGDVFLELVDFLEAEPEAWLEYD